MNRALFGTSSRREGLDVDRGHQADAQTQSLVPLKVGVRVRELERRIIRFCGGLSSRTAECDFAYRQVFGERPAVLDVGGVDSLLALQLAERGCRVTVLDCRRYHERHANLASIQGDFLANHLASESFDFVVMVGTIEHIGFGSYGGSVCDDGDLAAIAEAKRLLKPDGRIVLTVPLVDEEIRIPGLERWYDLARVRQLLDGLYILAEEYYIPTTKLMGYSVKWLPAAREQITSIDVIGRYGYPCFACFALALNPRGRP